ncbi:MAG: type IV pili twitching motility protein PilT [Deltaproteobacteria bacterium RIFCSPLOWO2_12_FULL_43_16]|nr:MAG: type IV pili twitching motility protein PilT [Deltaproteobacteria bacterium GWA2_43_19]OGQ10100.1 MAG: type IV pili twitching motility protein PilT [Deltaproteobacteria bacterium RIFCSPHIGHO2_02_FULL_43_33]OGQ58733.1 MAG: type IV pili twitching motility protein PilT [Deltaproteobacteria bacterium RIFCSPLOWO2_12_FULL_43_16]HBR17734.1 type IV pili twitching motility protein PilT [Deltaproteobacteria bacterium]
MPEATEPRKGPTLQDLLKLMIDKNGSDLHITAGSPPRIRIHGKLLPLDIPLLTPTDTKQMTYTVLADAQKHKFEEENELDFSFGLKGLSRFRGNLFIQRGAVAGVFRTIPFQIKTFQELGLPPVVEEFTKKPRGLILVTGPTGSGKSTTLASMINRINEEREDHIITIEDPIEYLHPSKKALVNQREVGADTQTFKKALKHVLRQDPDVVLLGELRDMETIETALTVAETGHVCFATLHTNSCVQTMNRIIDVFPAHQQSQIRAQLSFVLEGVMSQLLIPTADGKGRALALEIMVPNPAIRNLIREDKVHQIYSQMQVGQAKFGMQTMNQSLLILYQRRFISLEEAIGRSSEPDELRQMIANTGGMRPGGMVR